MYTAHTPRHKKASLDILESDVRKILGCSINKLQLLSVSRKIRTKKIGGTLYYNIEDISKLIHTGFE